MNETTIVVANDNMAKLQALVEWMKRTQNVNIYGSAINFRTFLTTVKDVPGLWELMKQDYYLAGKQDVEPNRYVWAAEKILDTFMAKCAVAEVFGE